MINVMKYVAARVTMQSDDAVLREIAQDANGNMRKALLVLEALKMQS
jgi:replication factor C subunit 3/5